MSEATTTGWIVTYTGKRFFPLAPRIEDLDIVDIAHALSNQCRFTGHCREFYSVAQHSILAAYHAPAWLKLSMLLHDASEAYLCDMSRPVKHSPGLSAFRAAEDAVQRLVGQRFGVSFDDPMVKQIDDRMLMTERRDLTNVAQTWSAGHLPPYEEIITPLAPGQAKAAFLRLADELLVPEFLR
jgi:5'-deoxynucleotidase YfbR-like HD superfamily hydrolase